MGTDALNHTCIKDDGGTPNRRCYACEAEKVIYTYKGQDIRFLSFDELLKATQWAFKQLEENRNWAKQKREMEALFAEVKERLKQ